MRIAIVDDLQEDRVDLRKIIDEFSLDRFIKLDKKIDIIIDEFNSGESLLCNFKPNYYDIIILDIYMNKLTGMDTARRIFAMDKSCNLIFTTTSKDYVFDSFEVKAVFYIIKPVTLHKEKLFTALDYCFENLKLDTSSLEVVVDRKSINLLLSNILYVDCQRRVTKFHISNTIIISNKSLTTYSHTLLEDTRFIECFRGIIVNMDYIDKVDDDDFVLTNGERLPITKRKKASIKNTYFEYFLKKRGA